MFIRDKMMAFRSSADLRNQLTELKDLTGKSQSDIIHEAVEKLWRQIVKAKAA